MTDFISERYKRYLPPLRDHVPRVPPRMTLVHIPLLRGETNIEVHNLLNGASLIMARLGAQEGGPHHDYKSWWQDQGTNRNRWSEQVRDVWDSRDNVMQLVASQLENQLIGFENLASRYRYNPLSDKLERSSSGQTDMETGIVTLGDTAFQSPSRLLNVMMHEGHHSWQANIGGNYLLPTALRDADAYLHGMEHHRLSGIGPDRFKHNLGWYKRYCDIDDRLAAGLPQATGYKGRSTEDIMNKDKISEMMDPADRADLERRFSLIEPEARRILSGSSHSNMWSRIPKTFSYEPMDSPSPGYDSGPPNLGYGTPSLGYDFASSLRGPHR